MTQQQIIQLLAQRMSVTMPCYFHCVSPVLTPQLQYIPNGVVDQKPFSLGDIDTINDAIECNPSTDVIGELVDVTEQHLKHYIHEVYFKMASDKMEVCNETDVYKQMVIHHQKTLRPGVPSIIINNGVDLYELQSIYPNHFRQISGQWYFGHIRIYDFQYTTVQSKYDSLFIFLNQTDAPFLDFTRKWERISNFQGTTIIGDPYQSLEIYMGREMKENGCPGSHLMVKPLIPLLYNPNANISALKVNIDYNNIINLRINMNNTKK